MGSFDVSSVKPQQTSSGFDVSTVKPVGETGGGAATVYPTQRATPSSPETQEQARSLAERTGEFLFGTPDRPEISGTEAAKAGGFGAAISAAAPKALKYGGKLVGILSPVAGTAMQAGGEALSKVPLIRRAITGGATTTIGDITEQAGEYLGIPRVVTLPVSFLTSAAGGYTTDLLARATGLEGRALSKELREKGVELTKDMLMKIGMDEKAATAELQRLQKIQSQLAGREGVATERALARQVSPMEAERQAVLNDVAKARVQAQEASRLAGENAQQAAARVAAAEQNVMRTQTAVENIERRLVAMPNMSKEDFGKTLQSTTQRLFDDANKARKEVANFKTIIQKAGETPSVSTNAMFDSLEKQIKKTGNPTVRQVLKSIQNEIAEPAVDRITGEVTSAAKPVSLAKADSLKGYIDNIINSKQFGETKLSKEILNQVRKTKTELFGAIRTAHPEYMEALNAFRTASRPLDIVERNGALAKVIERDPMSTEYKMKEAEIVGKIIAKAKAGNKVFERLIEKNPDVQDAARLYFVKDLYGNEIAPTEPIVRNWLKSNESVLRRTGLYDEFKNMQVARRTANEAVLEAKGGLEAAKQEAKAAEKSATAMESEAKKASSLQERAQKRLQDTLKTAEPIEDVLRRSAARARPAETKIAQQAGEAERDIVKQQALKTEYILLENEIKRTPAAQIPSLIQSKLKDFVKKGIITPEQEDVIAKQVLLNKDKFDSADKAIRQLKFVIPILGAVSYGGYKSVVPSEVITGR